IDDHRRAAPMQRDLPALHAHRARDPEQAQGLLHGRLDLPRAEFAHAFSVTGFAVGPPPLLRAAPTARAGPGGLRTAREMPPAGDEHGTFRCVQRTRVYLSPGMFGFARLASLEYFEHFIRAVEQRFRDRGRVVEIHVCEVHPTASILRRAA